MNATRLSPSRRREVMRTWWAEHLKVQWHSGQSQATAGLEVWTRRTSRCGSASSVTSGGSSAPSRRAWCG